MKNLNLIVRRLAATSCIRARSLLVRRVPLTALTSIVPPDFLYTSGKPNRYNPAETECIYFSETEEVARLEYEGFGKGIPGHHQPFVTYFARVRLERVLDLTLPATLAALKLNPEDLHTSWRGADHLTKTQMLGWAVATQSMISAIRYPSAAATESLTGNNLVIFHRNVRRPDYVRILGPEKKPLQSWP